jgi:RimJ/RimL family protein N-acetyltransferase
MIIETDRLILRRWRKEDAEAYFQINQDPRVIEFVFGLETLKDAVDFIDAREQHFQELGYTPWAVELKDGGDFIGYIGLIKHSWASHFTPAVEVSWRLGSQFWGKGYATEGAKASLAHGFRKCGLKEIVSFTVPINVKSLRVMEKIGLKRDLKGDFFHPKLPLGHKLSYHVLYRLSADQYNNQP